MHFLRKWSESWDSRNLVFRSHGGFMEPSHRVSRDLCPELTISAMCEILK